ncbi:MAG: glycosyltransferase family 2 protein [Patescibacteria group bacterium]
MATQYGQHRLLEIIPGALIWTTLVFAVVFSFVAPAVAIVFIIVFDLYWLFRVIYFVLYLFYSWRRYHQEVAVDWFSELQKISDWQKVYHVIFLPTYKESHEIMKAALLALKTSTYPTKQMIVVLAGEERDAAHFRQSAERLVREFDGVFFKLLTTIHPANLSDEIPGKGSNLHWSGNEVKKTIDALAIPYEHIVASAFDIDTIAHPQYFARLTHAFLTTPNPLRTSYQPVTTFSNNIWSATAPVRVASFGTTFWMLTELSRSERMWTFSSHSMPWQMLVDVGFWEKDMVSEDSRIFLQGLLHYHGDYRVTPIFLPVSMDAVSGKTYLDSLKALYKQQRRWAWGVEHFPYMVPKFLKDKQMPLRIKVKYVFNHVEGMYTWATAPILIFILGYLPLFVSHEASSVLVAVTPFTLEWIMRLAMIGVLTSGILSMTMLPGRPAHVKKGTWIVMIVQWAVLPITFVLFGSLPAIDAQTRLMLGKYLGFNVTKKERN